MLSTICSSKSRKNADISSMILASCAVITMINFIITHVENFLLSDIYTLMLIDYAFIQSIERLNLVDGSRKMKLLTYYKQG